MKRIGAVLLTVSILAAMVISSAVFVRAEETNVAKGKPVTGSGFIEADPPEDFSQVNDGDIDTKWCAKRENFNVEGQEYDEVGHWIQIDFEKEYIVSKFVIHQASECERDAGKYQFNMMSYKVEVSADGKDWVTLIEEEDLYDIDEDGEAIENYTKEFDPVSIRYFRFNTLPGAASLAEGDIVRIPEIEVFSAPKDAKAVALKDAKITSESKPTPTPTVKPTVTPSPAKTATPVPSATNTPAGSTSPVPGTEQGLPTGAVIAIIAGAVVIIGGLAAFLAVKKKK